MSGVTRFFIHCLEQCQQFTGYIIILVWGVGESPSYMTSHAEIFDVGVQFSQSLEYISAFLAN